MSRVGSPGRLAMAVALAVAMTGEAAAAVELEVVHQAIECVPSGRYARVEATGAPAESVVHAELQFRVRPDASWYVVNMTADGGSWSAALPRPVAPLTRFEYRIVLTAKDLAAVETAALPIRVAEDPAQCATPSSAALAAPIVVHVPAGAPVAPPVPPGFSPAGVVAATYARPKASNTKKWIGLGGVAAAVAVGAVAAASGAEPELPALPVLEFFGTVPTPGAAVSLSRDQFGLIMRVSGGDRDVLDLLWRIEWFPPTGGASCVFVEDRDSVGPGRPQIVTLTSGFSITGTCRAPFEAQMARISVVLHSGKVYDELQVLPFRFEP